MEIIRQAFLKTVPQSLRVGLVYPVKNKIDQWVRQIVELISLSAESRRLAKSLADGEFAAAMVGCVDDEWSGRIKVACECPDNRKIPRVANAGTIDGSLITMHNGIKIRAMSYYGAGILNLLIANKGVHEPQEEKVFGEVLQLMPDSPVMLELGAYWAFYSIWFSRSCKNASCYLIEPDPRNIAAGRENLRLNGLKHSIERAAVGDKRTSGLQAVRTITVDDFCERKGIKHLNILHADIQGSEHKMLSGCSKMFERRAVDFIFISTHSEELHQSCISFLEKNSYSTLCSATPAESYSCDGLLVAKRTELPQPETLTISRR